jgi:hypothetical protein
MIGQFERILVFLNKLERSKISYRLNKIRNDSILVEIAVPGERWEVEFFISGGIEVEIFKSNGDIKNETSLDKLFDLFSD